MFNIIKLTIGITVIASILLAIPVFAYILGGGLALVVLYKLIIEYEEAKNVPNSTRKNS